MVTASKQPQKPPYCRNEAISKLTKDNLVLVFWICNYGLMYLSIFRISDSQNGTESAHTDEVPATGRSWRNSEYICAFSDSERHFGHVIKTEQWHAYDATDSSNDGKGFKCVGTFADLAAAMHAVEWAVGRARESRAMQAG